MATLETPGRSPTEDPDRGDPPVPLPPNEEPLRQDPPEPKAPREEPGMHPPSERAWAQGRD